MHYSKIKVLFVITHKKSLRGIYLYFDIGDINLPIFISFLCHFFNNHFCNVMPLVLERNLCESALFWQPVALNYSCWIFCKKLLHANVEKLTKLLNSIFLFSRGQQSMVKVSFYMQSFFQFRHCKWGHFMKMTNFHLILCQITQWERC